MAQPLGGQRTGLQLSLFVVVWHQNVEDFKESLCNGGSEGVSSRRDCRFIHIACGNRQVSTLLGDDCSCPLDCPLREVIPAFDRNCFGSMSFFQRSFRFVWESAVAR